MAVAAARLPGARARWAALIAVIRPRAPSHARISAAQSEEDVSISLGELENAANASRAITSFLTDQAGITVDYEDVYPFVIRAVLAEKVGHPVSPRRARRQLCVQQKPDVQTVAGDRGAHSAFFGNPSGPPLPPRELIKGAAAA